MEKQELKLAPHGQTNGRAMLISDTGSLYIARGYSVYRSDDGGKFWSLDCLIPTKGWRPLVSKVSLAARILRFSIQVLQVLQDGSRLAVARDGIYRADPGEVRMTRTWAVRRGSRPINLSIDGNRVLFGEYGGSEMDSVQVRIYLSEDGGKQFDVVHEFPVGDVHHIHNIVVDRYADNYWVLAGDHGRTCGIGALSKDCRHLDWVARGNQMVRCVNMLTRPDCLIYGSDSELEGNHIIRLDRKTGQYEHLMPIEGSSLYAADFGALSVISTCVEPSQVNRSRLSCLYGSVDDVNWSRLLWRKASSLDAILFQIGTIILPYVQGEHPARGMFSGQTLQAGEHNRLSIFCPDKTEQILSH